MSRSVEGIDPTEPVAGGLRIEHLSKTFPGTRALSDVSLTVADGEVRALLGHNGSGKSTLIKVLAGFHAPDEGGAVYRDGAPIHLGDPLRAYEAGLRFVHQDLGLIPQLTAVENVALTIGYLRGRSGRVRHRDQSRRTREILERFGVRIDVDRPLAACSAVERTCVAIARAMWDWDQGPRVLVLDEPTASLPSREVAALFEVIREVRAIGHPVIYVSHRLGEIFDVADRVTVLRAGRVVGSGAVADFGPGSLSELIAGRQLEAAHAPRPRPAGDAPALTVRGLAGADLDGVDLDVRRGEIVGVAGLVGSGRDELPYALVGASPGARFERLELDGRPIAAVTPQRAGALGIAFVPGDRAAEGIVAGFSVEENLTLGSLPSLRRRGLITRRRERAYALRTLDGAGVDPGRAGDRVTSLSGGNQQKVLLARCLALSPRVLVLSEPTAGVDIGARTALYDLLRERAGRGMAIVLASSDVEDLVSVCDRVLVLRRGRIALEVPGAPEQAHRIVAELEAREPVPVPAA